MRFENEFLISDRLYVIPQDVQTRNDILSIDRKTKEDLKRTYGILVDHDWQCNTIANAYIENIIRILGLDVKNNGNGKASFNLYDLFDSYVTVKRNEDAEKEGNINIAFNCGSRIEALITDNVPREERVYQKIETIARFAFLDDPRKTNFYAKLDNISRLELSDKYGINIPNKKRSDADPSIDSDFIVTAIADTFMENLIIELLYNIGTSGKPSVSINFNDNIEAHAIIKNNGVVISLRPGMNAKLLIKSDETTEADIDDDDI